MENTELTFRIGLTYLKINLLHFQGIFCDVGERHGVLLEEMAAAWSSAFLCVRMLCVCVSTKALSSSDFQSTLN